MCIRRRHVAMIVYPVRTLYSVQQTPSILYLIVAMRQENMFVDPSSASALNEWIFVDFPVFLCALK